MIRSFRNRDFEFADEHEYTLREIVEGLGYDIFDPYNPYPIFDEDYREHLNDSVLTHFWWREIASETPAKFIFFLNRKMIEKMPAINVVYQQLKDGVIDPLATNQGRGSGENTNKNIEGSTGSTTGTSRQVFSDTPQTFLQNPDGEQYLSNITKTDSVGSSKGDTEANGLANYINKTTGIGLPTAQAVAIMCAGDFVNADLLVYKELEPLFLQFFDDMPR